MKYIFTVAVFLLSVSLGTYVSAADTDTGSGSASGAVASGATAELSVKTVKVLDDKHIRIVFTESIDVESVTLKIAKQSNNSAIRINVLTWVTDAPEAVDLTLEDLLTEGSAYSVTVLAAVGTSGSTITDGAQALKDFVTPDPLKKSAPTLSAPPNPAAVITTSTGEDEKVTPPLEVKKPEPKKDTPAPTEELPLTGMNPLWMLLIVFPFAYMILRKRSL